MDTPLTDNETGLMYARSRMYSPTLGRYINRHPWVARGRQLLSGYSIVVMPGNWQANFASLMLYKSSGYYQGRMSLYDFVRGSTSNYVEPFSDAQKIQNLKKEENFRDTAYLDSKGKNTVGYGANLEGGQHDKALKDLGYDPAKVKDGSQTVSQGDAEKMLQQDAEKAVEQSKDLVSNYENLDPDAKRVLAEMVFQMGKAGVEEFKKTKENLEAGDYEGAGDEMVNSKWGKKDSPDRAKTKAEEMRKAKSDVDCDAEKKYWGTP